MDDSSAEMRSMTLFQLCSLERLTSVHPKNKFPVTLNLIEKQLGAGEDLLVLYDKDQPDNL